MRLSQSPSSVRRAAAIRPTLILIIVVLLNSSCYPLITIGLRFSPHLSFAALRAILAGAALAILAVILRRPVPRGLQQWLMLGVIGFGTTSLGYLGMFHAAEFVSPGLATVIANSQPLLAAMLARLFLSERLGLAQSLGLLLGFAGILVISLSRLIDAENPGFALGLAYMLLAMVGVAVGNVCMKAVGSGVDPLVAMATQALLGAIPLVVAAALTEQPSTISWTPAFAASLLGLGLIGTALAYWLWFMVLGHVTLSHANPFTFLTPFVGYGLGIAFFAEQVAPAAVTGLLLTAVGVVLVNRQDVGQPP